MKSGFLAIGSFDLAQETVDGIKYYWAVPSSVPESRKAKDRESFAQQPGITEFQSQFAGAYPFTSDGVIMGLPSASFAEEMQTKITIPSGFTRTPPIDLLAHENFHQWFGDNVSEASFNLTFWKEGWAMVGEYIVAARTAADNAGGLDTPAGDAAFDASLVKQFNTTYGTNNKNFWTRAPSNPTVGSLFSGSATYDRPGAAYLALRQILGASASRPVSDRWIAVMKQIQSQYRGGVISEPQLEAVFQQWLPNQSAACHAQLDQFFTQWFDTAYAPGGGADRPQLTGPGLDGPGFYNDGGACTRAAQTITFGPLPARSAGDPDFDVAAASDSGLPVSFSSSGQCAVAGNTVHITGPGSCTITASQAGDGVYKPAMPVSQAFAIAGH